MLMRNLLCYCPERRCRRSGQRSPPLRQLLTMYRQWDQQSCSSSFPFLFVNYIIVIPSWKSKTGVSFVIHVFVSVCASSVVFFSCVCIQITYNYDVSLGLAVRSEERSAE